MAVREHYSHVIADQHKAKKRKEAETRTELRASRTDEQQLARLDANGWKASKEKKRLRDKINRRKENENTGRNQKTN